LDEPIFYFGIETMNESESTKVIETAMYIAHKIVISKPEILEELSIHIDNCIRLSLAQLELPRDPNAPVVPNIGSS
jgi:hypothetical protein